MSKYLDRISINKEAKEQAGFKQAAAQAKIQVAVDKLALEQAKTNAETVLETAKSAIPFNLNAVVQAKRTVANIEEDLAAAEAVEAELFGN